MKWAIITHPPSKAASSKHIKGQFLSLRKAKQGGLLSQAEVCHSSKGTAGPCHMTSLLLLGNEVTQMAWPEEGQEGRCCSSLQPLPHSLLRPLHVPSLGCFSCGIHTTFLSLEVSCHLSVTELAPAYISTTLSLTTSP